MSHVVITELVSSPAQIHSFLLLDEAISKQNMLVIGTTLTTICMAMENFPSLDTAQSFSASNMKWQQENSSLETYKDNM